MSRNKKLLLGLVGLLFLVLSAWGVAKWRAHRAEGSGKAAPSGQQWQCPMHPQVISDRPGDCPICNMKLVPITAPTPAASAPAAGPRKVKFYRSPMNPAQTSPVPRKDEMGMDYVPVYEDEAAAGAAPAPAGYAPIQLSPERQQLLGLKTVEVKAVPLSAKLRTTGRVAYNETLQHHVHARFEGYVEQIYADFTGKFVKKGEPLAAVYSPELLAAETEYLIALGSRQLPLLSAAQGKAPEHGVDLVASARQKLRLWNISDADIQALARRGQPSETLKLYAPISGYVINKTAVHGMRIKPDEALFEIVDLSRVWVLADVYEYELPRLRLGQTATMTLPYWPDRSWTGRITYIYPAIDPKTRTVKVRLEVANPRNDLKAEMFATVLIAAEPRTVLALPEDAVLETGTRRIVFVAQEEGRLLPREVVTGDRADRQIEIKSGLKEGERVALGAAFLVDSESRLQSAIAAGGVP